MNIDHRELFALATQLRTWFEAAKVRSPMFEEMSGRLLAVAGVADAAAEVALVEGDVVAHLSAVALSEEIRGLVRDRADKREDMVPGWRDWYRRLATPRPGLPQEEVIPTIAQLDAAISHVLGPRLDDVLHGAGIGRTGRHDKACMVAFDQRLEGPEVEVLRAMRVHVSKTGFYPAMSFTGEEKDE